MKLISEKMTRRDLAEKLALGGVDLKKQIKALKQSGQLIETRDYIDPARTKKRSRRFCFLAKNLEIEI